MNEVGGRLVARLILDTSKFEASMDKVHKKFAEGMTSGKAMTNVILNMSQVLSDAERSIESMSTTAKTSMAASTAATATWVSRLAGAVPVLTTLRTATTKLYEASMALAAPLALVGGLSARAFSNFDQNVARVATGLHLNGAQREQMQNRVFDISSQSITPPDELVRAYGQLSRAGLDATRSMAALNSVNRFAIANDMEAADATRHLISVQRELGLARQDAKADQDQLNHMMDVITKTTTLANVSATEMLDALGNRAAIGMRQLGMSLEQGAAVMGVFAEQGIRGTAAGQRFEMMLRELQIAATRHSAEWRRMGFALYDAQGKFLPMSAIMRQLESSFHGASDEQKRYILQGLGFSDRTIQVVRSLVGFSRELGVFESQLSTANGTTQKAYDIYMKSFSAQMMILWNNIKIVGIEIGQVLAPWILRLNEGIRAGIAWWRSLNPQIREIIIGFTLIAAAAGPVIFIFNTIVGGILSFIATAGALAVIAGILGIIGFAILYVSQAISDPAGGFVGAWNNSIDAVTGFFGAIPGFLANFSENMGILWTWLQSNWWKVLGDIFQIIVLFCTNSLQMFIQLVVFVIDLIVRMGAEIIRIFTRIINSIWAILTNLSNNMIGLMLLGVQGIASVINSLFDLGGELLEVLGHSITSIAVIFGNLFMNVAIGILWLGQRFVVFLSWLASIVLTYLSWIARLITTWIVNIGLTLIREVMIWGQTFFEFFKSIPEMAQVAFRAVAAIMAGQRPDIALGGAIDAIADNFRKKLIAAGRDVENGMFREWPAVQMPDADQAGRLLGDAVNGGNPTFHNLMEGTDFSTNFQAVLDRFRSNFPRQPEMTPLLHGTDVHTNFQTAFDTAFVRLQTMPGFTEGFHALADAWPEFNLAFKETADTAAGVETSFRRMTPNIPGLDDGTGLNAVPPDPTKHNNSHGKSEFHEMSFGRFLLGNPSAQFDINRKRHVSDTTTHDKLDRLIDVSSRDRAAILG